MRILRLLNKINLTIILILNCTLTSVVYSQDQPVDIWKIGEIENDQSVNENDKDKIIENQNNDFKKNETDIFKLQTENLKPEIELDSALESKEVKIVGLYDPEDYGLDINMWTSSDGDQLKNIFSNINKISLSDDAAEIMNISILTNAYYPKRNISEIVKKIFTDSSLCSREIIWEQY